MNNRTAVTTALASAAAALLVSTSGAFASTGASAAATDPKAVGRIGPSLGLTANGRALAPAGRQTVVGNFPGGAAITPDGRFEWVISAGHSRGEATVVRLSDGVVTQRLPLPGSTGYVAFSPDGSKAYVSGISKGETTPFGPVKGPNGDVIHVFSIDTEGVATEQDPIALPARPGGGQSMPNGLAVSHDGKTLAVTLLRGRKCSTDTSPCTGTTADVAKLVMFDLDNPSAAARQVNLAPGGLTHGVAFTVDDSKALVTDELTGKLDIVDVATGSWTAVGVGGLIIGDGTGDPLSHPGAVVVSPDGQYAYVAVANRDVVARVKLADNSVTWTSVGRPQSWGTQPVSLALAGNRLYVADSGEDALAVLDLSSGNPVLAGRIPTAAYPTAVSATPDGASVIWVASKGLGTGPNGTPGPNGYYIPDNLIGRLGMLAAPTVGQLATYTAQANAAVKPTNAVATAPSKTALKAGGPIKHVFYIIRENKTYDQVLGSDTRGDGDPSLVQFDDNGKSGPTGGITPNVHALVRRFPLLDHFYSNAEVSVDGHLIASQGMAIDTAQRRFQFSYSGRGYDDVDFLQQPTYTPKVSIFDQAARKNVSAVNYGEAYAGNFGDCLKQLDPNCKDPTDDGRSTYAKVKAMTDKGYTIMFGCSRNPADDKTLANPNLMNSNNCRSDSSANGLKHAGFAKPLDHSRVDYWRGQFAAQVKANKVPALTVMSVPNDHTNGVTVGYPTPQAMIADNDLALGQIVETISKSKIWKDTAIFVQEDDSQAGTDHVDGHRQPGLVISPWAKKAAVVHTRYDQDSMLRSAMMLLGLEPITLADALATPMYDAFIRTSDKPDTRTYTAIKPTYPLTAVTTAKAARRAGNLANTFVPGQLDAIPQPLLDAQLWKSTFGDTRPVPSPGPGSSTTELNRARIALKAIRAGKPIPFDGAERD